MSDPDRGIDAGRAGQWVQVVQGEAIINHPPHYTSGKIEVITAIEDWGLGYHLGNVVKYVARAGLKGSPLEDLKKARWYLDRAIDKLAKGDPIADLRTKHR